MTGPSYDLFCVDTGDFMDTGRYLGPYGTRRAAELRLPDNLLSVGTVRRCRRLSPTDLDRDLAKTVLSALTEVLEEGDGPANAWADWEGTLVEEHESLQAALMRAITECLTVNAFVCEGDE